MKQRRERDIPIQSSQRRVRERVKITMCLFLFALLFLPTTIISTFAADNKIEIKILATSDMHNTFYPYDYAADEPYTRGGLPRVASAIAAARTANTILIDNGDTIQGIASNLNMDDAIMPMLAGMNAIGYDIWSSGNHEYNFGVPFLEKTAATFSGQFLAANVYDQKGQRLRGAKNYTVLERGGVKIAVIGIVTPNITRWDRDNMADYQVSDPKAEVAAAVEEIQAGNLADLTVVSFHASLNGEYEGLTDSVAEIARDVPHIDAMIAGHEHSVFNTVVEGKTHPIPIVEPGRYGDYVSEITLNVSLQDGVYKVLDYTHDIGHRNIKTADYPNDPTMLELLAPYHERALADAQTIIGELRDGPLVKEAEIRGITQAQIEDTPLLDLILKVQMDTAQRAGVIPNGARHVSGASLFNASANMQEGKITKANAARIYRFDNTLMTMKAKGSDFKKYVEWSAGYYNQFKPGDLTISYNQDIRTYNYDMFSGVTYELDISKPIGSRIIDLKYTDGTPVEDTDEVYVTVNNYRVNTHLVGRLFGADAQLVYDSGNSIRDDIVRYIAEKQVIYPDVDHNWRIIGYEWNEQLHQMIRTLINRGDITIPYSADGRTPNVRSMRRSDIIEGADVIDMLSINDFHGAVEEQGKNIGGAKMGSVVKNKRSENPNTVLLGAGDLFQGSAISNLTKGEVVSALLREYGMLFSAVGNHEFDWGVQTIPQMAEQGGFQFLAANIIEKQTNQQPSWAEPFGILEIAGKRIGFIGLTTPTTAYQTVPSSVEHLAFLDPIETAQKWEQHLRSVEGVDLVFALTHMASEQEGDTIKGEAADLARGVPTLDGIFSSHSHRFVQGRVAGVPIVQGGYNGRGISNMSIVYAKDGTKLGVVPTMEELYKEVDTLAEDTDSKEIIARFRAQLAPILGEVIGINKQDLPHERIAGIDLTAMGQATAKMMSEISGTDIALINGGGIRAGLNQGDITIADMYMLFPFDNTLATAEVTGAQLQQAIEHGIHPPTFRSGQFYGLQVWYEEGDEQAGLGTPHVRSMRLLNGEKIQPDQTYKIATVDFILEGGDRYDLSGAMNIVNTGKPLRDQLTEHIKAKGGIEHTFVQTLILGADPTLDEPSLFDPIDKDRLVPTGGYGNEIIAVSLLLFTVSAGYLKRRCTQV